MIRYPAPLLPGSRIAVTAPSAGVMPGCHARLDLILAALRAQGFIVDEGACLRANHKHVSAPLAQRVAEFQRCLLDPAVAAILPPWGGELAIELLPRLDWAAIEAAAPTWLTGYSDVSTLALAMTLRLGIATAHGPNLMDLAPDEAEPLTAAALARLATPAGGGFVQHSSSRWQKDWQDFEQTPDCSFDCQEPTRLAWLSATPGGAVSFSGRLIGGCLDTVRHLAGSPFGDVPGFIRRSGSEGVILYFENCDLRPVDFIRSITGLRLAGWFDGLAGVLVGRSSSPAVKSPEWLSHREAMVGVLADLPCPVIIEADIGHLPPQWLLINGAQAEVHYAAGAATLTQQLS